MDDLPQRVATIGRRGFGVVCTAWALTGCGGGGGGGDASTAPPLANPVVSLQFDPIDTVFAPGTNLFLRLRARYQDGTSAEVTGLAAWSSTQPNVATVGNLGAGSTAGMVAAVAVGRSSIVAAYQGLTATLDVTVASGVLRAIEAILPAGMAIGIGAQFRIVATAHYTDRSQTDDQTLTWTSSAPDVATVSSQTGLRGTVTGLRPGTTTITASKDGVTWSTAFTVLNIRVLAGRPIGSAELGPDPQATARIDAAGRMLALYGYVPVGPARPAALVATRPAGDGPWSAPASLGAAALEQAASARDLTMNDAGQALVGWLAGSRLYVARCTSSGGVEAPQLLTDTASMRFSLAIAGDGSGIAVWNRLASDGTTQIAFRRWDAGAGAWSSAAQVPGTELARGSGELWRLVMNDAGQAALLWRRRPPMVLTPAPGDDALHALMVSRFEPGAAGGWQAADTLQSTAVPSSLDDADVALNATGGIVAVWIRPTGSTSTGSLIGDVRTRFFAPGRGWSADRDVVTASPLAPSQPRIAFNDAGAAALAWQTRWDNGLWMAATLASGNWSTASNAFTPELSLRSGTPEVLRVAMTADGRALAAWRVDLDGLRSNLATVRYTPVAGWGTLAAVPTVGRLTSATNIQLHFNRIGDGTAVWSEGTGEGACLYTAADLQV